MRAARDAAGAFRQRDERQAGERGAIGGREDQQAVVVQRFGEAADEAGGVADMLDDLEAGDEVEAAGHAFDAGRAVINGEAALRRMRFCHRDIFRRRIDAGDGRAQSRERFGEQPGAAADVERRLAGERREAGVVAVPMQVDRGPDVAQPHRVELVEHRRRAFGVPPVLRHASEMLGLAGVDGGGAGNAAGGIDRAACACHGRYLSGRTLSPKEFGETRWHVS